MVASNIKVFFRVRPSARPSKAVAVKQEDGLIEFVHEKDGEVNNSRTYHKFRFDGILPMKISQEEVFQVVAKPVIEDVMEGINGTIFAYGQTGSGKTFTITGGAERYEDRGLIPRTIAYIFEEFKKRKDASYRMFISYLEIYNNDGYDLLSREETTSKLEDLPKVQLREDEEGNIHLRNLSVNMAQKEEDALNLLFLGDTNRVVAETPMNDVSTRSHCMFIMWVESTKPDSDTVRRAKLHLVDLAGSERISKSGVEGQLQKEARYINLSLHYLEQVIVALHERSTGGRNHVPYRNSMMTSVLRDSLGGNCKTVMVGTAAIEDRHLEESMSTCRFAQRVAAIKNNATVNEELDPALLIRRLKKEAAELKDELKLLNGDDAEDLNEDDKKECQKLVQAYLVQQDLEALFVAGSLARYQECFSLLRDIYWQKAGSNEPLKMNGAEPRIQGNLLGTLEGTLQQLRQEVAMRDQEISMLVGSLSKRGNSAKEAAAAGPIFIPAAGAAAGTSAGAQGQGNEGSQGAASPPERVAGADSAALLLDRNKAFDAFRKSVRRSETLDEGRDTRKQLVIEAKEVGERANAARASVQTIQSKIEKERLGRAMGTGPRADPSLPVPGPAVLMADTPEVAALEREKEEKISTYKKCMERLKVVKAEIEKHKSAAKENQERLQRDFEAWYLSLQAHQADLTEAAGDSGPARPASAGSPSPVPEASPRSNSAREIRKVPTAGVPAVPATSLQSPPAPAEAFTGHQQTDDDIRAYFAAVADLESR